VTLAAYERRILRRALVEWRNYLIERDDVDRILIRRIIAKTILSSAAHDCIGALEKC